MSTMKSFYTVSTKIQTSSILLDRSAYTTSRFTMLLTLHLPRALPYSISLTGSISFAHNITLAYHLSMWQL